MTKDGIDLLLFEERPMMEIVAELSSCETDNFDWLLELHAEFLEEVAYNQYLFDSTVQCHRLCIARQVTVSRDLYISQHNRTAVPFDIFIQQPLCLSKFSALQCSLKLRSACAQMIPETETLSSMMPDYIS